MVMPKGKKLHLILCEACHAKEHLIIVCDCEDT